MNFKKFTGREGQLVPAAEAEELTLLYRRRKEEILGRGENFVQAEFFGLETFRELIDLHGDKCVGFRVYYGIRDEEDNSIEPERFRRQDFQIDPKKPTSRLILVPVDADGNDLTASAQLGGMKDMPAQREVMLGGPLCPSHC